MKRLLASWSVASVMALSRVTSVDAPGLVLRATKTSLTVCEAFDSAEGVNVFVSTI